MGLYPLSSWYHSISWPYRASQYFKSIKGNRNAGAIAEEDVRVRHGMFFAAVDTDFPIILSVCGCHGEIVV